MAAILTAGGLVVAGAGAAHAEAEAEAGAVGSPGIISGNALQVPVHVPINLCGNTVDIIGVLNPAFGNGCANAEAEIEVDDEEPPNNGNGEEPPNNGNGEKPEKPKPEKPKPDPKPEPKPEKPEKPEDGKDCTC
ncbi:chaplin [Allostreptomyces psammosilenae]|uniref:Outer membrane biosynthesis protein TonB n=1 Tax=Allostreptomyces psammosilenae TaxID=1892865 RepID=A0A852ZPM7_9ACTN|nr:chaplin [Allostreptomyces psammosilenae]NYI04406.1 outer membrane biosynthesis protein TonB [Allostreptomyces psammosilenae]